LEFERFLGLTLKMDKGGNGSEMSYIWGTFHIIYLEICFLFVSVFNPNGCEMENTKGAA